MMTMRQAHTTDNAIYITTQSGSVSNSTLLVTTFDDTMGKPVEISVSPDGTQLIFELYTRVCPGFVNCREATVWMMNIDGSELHLLATTNDEEPMVNSTVWSPDGKWVATVEGYFGGMVEVYDPIQPGGEWHWKALDGVPGVLYAIPSTSESVTLPGNGGSGVVPIAETTSDGLLSPMRAGYIPEMKWLPDIPIATEERGSLPTNVAALSGTIYFDDDGEGNAIAMHAINVQDTTDQILFNLTDDDLDNVDDLVYSSRDGRLFSHYCSDYGNSYDDDRRFIIYDQNEQILANILGQENGYNMSVRRAIRFSPVDSNLLLILYSDYHSGSETYADYLVTVLDWNSKTFLKHFKSQEYNAVDWTAEGDILLAGEDGNVYSANVTDQGISDPVLYISGQDNIKSIAVSPEGNSIAYTLNEQIWVSDINGDNFQRLTGFTSGYNMFPEWSPDGRYIAFKHIDEDDQSPTDPLA
jgi:WD40 repeat protein